MAGEHEAPDHARAWREPLSIAEADRRRAAAVARARAIEGLGRRERALRADEHAAAHAEASRLKTWIARQLGARGAGETDARLRAAWRLLRRCAPHVPPALRAEVDAAVPAAFVAREERRG